jgi:hypothetical protein
MKFRIGSIRTAIRLRDSAVHRTERAVYKLIIEEPKQPLTKFRLRRMKGVSLRLWNSRRSTNEGI